MEGRFTVSAPTRVDLAGGTLDLWPLYCLTEGAKTINLALDLCTEARFEYGRAEKLEIEVKGPGASRYALEGPLSLDECKKQDPAIRFPLAVLSGYLARRTNFPSLQVRVTWNSQVPVGSGLGGSSTLGVALIRGISRVFGDFSDMGWQWALLALIKDIEAGFLETPTGTQDYLAALFGGLSCFYSRPGEILHVPYPPPVLSALASRTVVLFSGEQHHSGKSNWEVFKAALEKDATVRRGLDALRRIADQVDTALRETQLDWTHLGKLLSEEWFVRRELFGVSTPRLDTLLAGLKKKNILGAKVCGAAAGGSILVLVDPNEKQSLCEQMEREGIQVLPTKPLARGVQIL